MLYCDKSHYQQFTPPFDIPDSWEWVRLEDISYAVLGKMLDKSKNKGVNHPYLRNINVRWFEFDVSDLLEMPFEMQEADRYSIKHGDLVICEGGEPGRCAVWDKTEPIMFQKALHRVRFFGEINSHFISNIIYLYCLNGFITTFFTGSGIKHLTGESLANIPIPMPPIKEQQRILKSVNSFDIIIQQITDDKKLLSNTIILIKSKIIDLAMQGKLVPQDPADEPAADMLRRVNPKAKIITDNPQCRNLPLGWTLCQLRDLCLFLSRGKSPKYSETPNQYPVFAQKCNLKDGDISLTQARFLDENTISKWPEKYRLRDGDVLVNSTGTGTVGRTRMFKSEYLGNYPFVVPDSHVSVVRSFDEIDSTYIFYCLYCQDGQQYFAENLAGSTNQKELYIDVIGDKSIMLPPINEQKRIVAKIEEQYSVLYEIEASLRS